MYQKNWGFDEKTYSVGLSTADLDNDGDMDIIINNIDDYSSIYENKTNSTNIPFLKIRLEGPKSNRTGIGSKIIIYYGGNLQYIDNNPYRGFMSTVDKNILFGTGDYTILDSLAVIWPDGSQVSRYNVSVDTTIIIKYKNTPPKYFHKAGSFNKSIRFKEITSQLGISYKHNEDQFIDFYSQPSLPHMTSQLGPSVAVGDINNDGLEDFFVGGARGFPATLFFQTSNGSFRSQDYFLLMRSLKTLEHCCLILTETTIWIFMLFQVVHLPSKNSEIYQDRLYLNIGNGKFKKTENILPRENSSGSVVTAADFDRDGDLDLFVGGRIIPMNYPCPQEAFC